MKKYLLLFVCCLLICLVSCNHNNANVTNSITTNEHFSITKTGNQFYCEIYNNSGETITVFGPTYKQPDVSIINNYIVKYSTQAGTGKSTQSTVYCNTTNGVCSQIFYGVFDETNTMVAYLGGINQIKIQNIFDEHQLIILNDFDKELSPVIEPFISVAFSNDEKNLIIKYLTGPNFVVEEKIFNLEGDARQGTVRDNQGRANQGTQS